MSTQSIVLGLSCWWSGWSCCCWLPMSVTVWLLFLSSYLSLHIKMLCNEYGSSHCSHISHSRELFQTVFNCTKHTNMAEVRRLHLRILRTETTGWADFCSKERGHLYLTVLNRKVLMEDDYPKRRGFWGFKLPFWCCWSSVF